jgi:biotin carboxyl carrier protein
MKFNIHLDNAEHTVDAAADGTLVVDSEAFEVRVSCPSGDRRTVQVGDKTYEVRVVAGCATGGASGVAAGDGASGGPAGSYMLEIAGERVPVTVTEVIPGVAGGGAAALAAVGESAGSSPARPPGGAAPAEAAGSAESAAGVPREVKEGIWAPVPGKIVEVFVKAGDTVKEGDLVLILEAMKMENELHASMQATVAAVLVKKGDQAESGQLLVAFE